ncbi:hypothetical protein GCM10022419_124720 [Nonomuraea rosea]|uniref:Uncharacterized protein n=1 Tax=Nonomuraea rosea TaxID=638574 RepID=A0ABP6ZRX8_9ACTN
MLLEGVGTVKGLHQLGDLAAGPTNRRFCQRPRVLLARDERFHDRLAGHAVHIGQHAGQLDQSILEQLLHLLLLPGPILGQVPPVAGMQPDRPELLWWPRNRL